MTLGPKDRNPNFIFRIGDGFGFLFFGVRNKSRLIVGGGRVMLEFSAGQSGYSGAVPHRKSASAAGHPTVPLPWPPEPTAGRKAGRPGPADCREGRYNPRYPTPARGSRYIR